MISISICRHVNKDEAFEAKNLVIKAKEFYFVVEDTSRPMTNISEYMNVCCSVAANRPVMSTTVISLTLS